jgi:hypothetical protein
MRFLTIALMLTCGFANADDVRLNQIQVIGTHNSYHIAPAPAVKSLLQATRKGWFEAIDYTHRPLVEQFETLGIRQIELDVFADPKGGLFAKPAGRSMAKAGDLGPDPNEKGALDAPGFKVLHVQDVDYRSTVPTFAEGLKQIRDWSRAHPRHVPIMVQVELKDQAQPLLPTKPVPFTAELLIEIDEVIRKAFPDAIAAQSYRANGWPKLDDCRGKVMFVLDNEGTIGEKYRNGSNRVMFALRSENDPLAAVFKINEPIADFDRIRSLVKKGFLVRTRADADTVEARKNDTTRREKAFASGAQFVSTDFPEARSDLSPYVVEFDGKKKVRFNPVTAAGKTGEVEGKLTAP